MILVDTAMKQPCIQEHLLVEVGWATSINDRCCFHREEVRTSESNIINHAQETFQKRKALYTESTSRCDTEHGIK